MKNYTGAARRTAEHACAVDDTTTRPSGRWLVMSTTRLTGCTFGQATRLAVAVFVLVSLASGDAASGAKRERKAAAGQSAGEELARVQPFEMQLLESINQERKQYGVAELKLDPKLSNVARGHSQEMRDRNFFGHISPVPAQSTPRKRYESAFGREPYIIGENVARRAGTQWCLTDDRIEKTHRGLMDSPGHRENILRREFQQIGIGIAINEVGDYWVTELFLGESLSNGKWTAGRARKKQ
jgi:uncharacterized protein YkwD